MPRHADRPEKSMQFHTCKEAYDNESIPIELTTMNIGNIQRVEWHTKNTLHLIRLNETNKFHSARDRDCATHNSKHVQSSRLLQIR